MLEPPHRDATAEDAPAAPPRIFADALREEHADRIVRIVAQSLDMPMVLFFVHDGERYWDKSWLGLTPAQARHLTRFCSTALQLDSVLLVNDTLGDRRFAPVPGATDHPAIRFYAGIPVRSPGGARDGALWLLDRRPRELGAGQLAIFADLARLLERELLAERCESGLLEREMRDTSIRSLLDYLPEAVLMLGPDGVIVSCNAVAERMYAAGAPGLVGRSSAELIAEDPAPLREALRAGDRDQLQAMARRLDGSVFSAELSVTMLDASGLRRYVLSVRDVSTRKARERSLRESDARRRKYFVTATHELRTPMASVLGFSELLLKRDFEAPERKEMLDIIHRQASRLVNLVNEMLDLARIETGGADALDLRPQDAGAVLEQTLAGLEGLGATHRIRCTVKPQLPPVLADAAKLQQALTNIIGNAIKYSAASSDIRVDLFDAQLDGGAAVGFSVADRGIGMTPEQRANIFEPFYRADGESETVGSGLGMTIFKEIIDLHGGVVRIESTPGAGTDIVLLLPTAATR
jgi:PAS domain S-box-containing protein